MEDIPTAHFEELVQTVLRLARREALKPLPTVTRLTGALELSAMHPSNRLLLSLQQVTQPPYLPSVPLQELIQTVLRLSRQEPFKWLPAALELTKALDLAELSVQDRLIRSLRQLVQQENLPASWFQELMQTVIQLANREPYKSLPGVTEFAGAVDLAAMHPADQLIFSLRQVVKQQNIPSAHFLELVHTVLHLLQHKDNPALAADTDLMQVAQLATMSPADRLIATLRQLEQQSELPSTHFKELVETVFRLSRLDSGRAAALESAKGAVEITAAQDAIVRNLAQTIIGDRKFLVVDVGANDGWFIDRILAEPRDIHLLAFEPMPQMDADLQKRKQHWPAIELFQQAVGDQPGILPLRIYPTIPGLSSLLEFESGYCYFKGQFNPEEYHTVEVPVVTLDDHFEQYPHLAEYNNLALKIDVQGFEDRVLRGAQKLLESGRVKAILIEMVTRQKYSGSWDYLTLMNYLNQYGFVLYDINPFYREIEMTFQSNGCGRLTEMDCLFVKADELKAVLL